MVVAHIAGEDLSSRLRRRNAAMNDPIAVALVRSSIRMPPGCDARPNPRCALRSANSTRSRSTIMSDGVYGLIRASGLAAFPVSIERLWNDPDSRHHWHEIVVARPSWYQMPMQMPR